MEDFTFDQFIYVDCGEEKYQDVEFTTIKIIVIGGILDKIFRNNINLSIKIYLKLNNKVKIGDRREDNYDYSDDLQLLNEIIEALKKNDIAVELYINDEWNVEDVYNISYTDKSTLMLLYGHGTKNSPKIMIGTGKTIDDDFDVNVFLTKKTDNGKLIAGFATCYSKDIMRSQDLIPKKICYLSLDSENDTCSNHSYLFESVIDLIMYHSRNTGELFPTSIGLQFMNHAEKEHINRDFKPFVPNPQAVSNWDGETYIYPPTDDESDENNEYDESDEDDENKKGGSYKKTKRSKKYNTKKKRGKKRYNTKKKRGTKRYNTKKKRSKKRYNTKKKRITKSK
jgi:hypothetical protein